MDAFFHVSVLQQTFPLLKLKGNQINVSNFFKMRQLWLFNEGSVQAAVSGPWLGLFEPNQVIVF